MDAPTLRLHLPLLVSRYGGLNSLILELYNKPYLDNKLSYYIRVAVWQQIFLKIRCNVVVFNQSMLFLYKVKKPQFLLVKPRLSLAGPTRLELATSGLTEQSHLAVCHYIVKHNDFKNLAFQTKSEALKNVWAYT